MAAGFTQDTVFHFLQSCGGSVKNADLLTHFRSFIRENPEREKNRELFKRFVNSLATVQQIDGVSYVVLRKKFRGNVPGGGEQGSRVAPGKKREVSPGNGAQSLADKATKPRPQLPGGAPGKQVLPVAGFIMSDVETNSNLSQQPVTSRFEDSIRPAAAQLVNLTSGQCQSPPQAPPQAHLPNVGQHIRGAGHPLETPAKTTPAKIAADNHMQVPVTRGQPPGRQALSQAGVSPPPETSGRQALLQSGLSSPPQTSGRQALLQAGLSPPPETSGRQTLLQSGLSPPPETSGRQALLQAGLSPPPQTSGRQALLQSGLSPPPQTSGRQALLQAGLNPPPQTSGRQALLQAGLNPPPQTSGRQALLQAGLSPPPETSGRQALLQSGLSPPPETSGRQALLQAGLSPPPQTSERQALLQSGLSPPPQTSGRQALLQAGLNPPPQTSGRQALLQAGLNPPPPTTSRHRHRPSYKSAVCHDDDDDDDEDDGPVGPISAGRHVPHGSLGKALFAPSPSNIDSPAPYSSSSSSSERTFPQIYIQNAKGEMLSNTGLPWRSESDRQTEEWLVPGLEYGSVPRQLTRRSLPEEVRCYSPDPANEVPSTMGQTWVQPAGGYLEPRLHHSQRSGRSSSHNSIFTPSPGVGISRGLHCNSSLEELHSRPGKTGGDLGLQETLQLTQRNKLGETRHSSDHLHVDQEPLSWHRSRGHVHTDQGESESSDGSTSSPHLRKQPACGRRVSSHLRSRMCLSLGADLDQLLQEDSKGRGGGGSEAARLNRLNLISSSLSLHRCLSSSSLSSCSTPPRCQSLGDLVEVRGRRSNPPAVCTRAHDEDQSKQSSVPLEAREHAWLVKGAAGAWPDIYSLFREDSSLLNRRDFISGFTVLHWVAKHGDHRVLNTLWYGVEKAGVNFDINARSTSGHTPLHIATIHGHKNIIRLLVNKFGADMRLRDMAGKKAWQYLDCAMPLDVFQLLGAPPRVALKGAGEVGKIDVARQSSRRRRRHRFSSASPVHKQLASKVKRSSSLAAFLKHKSLNLYQAQQIDVSV